MKLFYTIITALLAISMPSFAEEQQYQHFKPEPSDNTSGNYELTIQCRVAENY